MSSTQPPLKTREPAMYTPKKRGRFAANVGQLYILLHQLIKALFSLVGLILLFLLGLFLVRFLSLLLFLLLHLCKSLYHGRFQQVGSDLATADTK